MNACSSGDKQEEEQLCLWSLNLQACCINCRTRGVIIPLYLSLVRQYLDCCMQLWTTPVPSARQTFINWSAFSRGPRMVKVGTLALWGEAEGPGLVQPGAGTASGPPSSSPTCLWGGYQGERPATHGQEVKGNLQKLK